MSHTLKEFRALVMANIDLQAALMAELDFDSFCARALGYAARAGIALERSDIDVPPDPAGIMRFIPRPADGEAWPPIGWVPVGMAADAGGPIISWHCFDGIAVNTPFFHDAAMTARARPFNRALSYRISLAKMMEHAPSRPRPAGFIFHFSRCGSTLVHRMLGMCGAVTTMSEVPIFDEALQFCLGWQGPQEVKHRILQTIAAGLGNVADGRSIILKLDAWHILLWPLLRAAFPDTPAIFLYREPLEVLVSQQRMRGMQVVPQPTIATLCGIEDCHLVGLDEYCARFLSSCCNVAAEAVRAGTLRAINYRNLPSAVFAEVLDYFGLKADDAELARMRAAAGVHSKTADQRYVPDSSEKRLAADAPLRELAQRIVGPAYRDLDALAKQ